MSIVFKVFDGIICQPVSPVNAQLLLSCTMFSISSLLRIPRLVERTCTSSEVETQFLLWSLQIGCAYRLWASFLFTNLISVTTCKFVPYYISKRKKKLSSILFSKYRCWALNNPTPRIRDSSSRRNHVF